MGQRERETGGGERETCSTIPQHAQKVICWESDPCGSLQDTGRRWRGRGRQGGGRGEGRGTRAARSISMYRRCYTERVTPCGGLQDTKIAKVEQDRPCQ